MNAGWIWMVSKVAYSPCRKVSSKNFPDSVSDVSEGHPMANMDFPMAFPHRCGCCARSPFEFEASEWKVLKHNDDKGVNRKTY